MKKMILAFGLLLCVACTSESAKLEDQAMDEATKEFQSELREELAKSVAGKSKIQFTAVDIITKKTTFSVAKKNVGDSVADFEIEAKTIPAKVRSSLIDIMAKLEDSREARFNVSDAIKLITGNLGLSSDDTTSLIYKINLKKSGGNWHRTDSTKGK